VHNSELRRVVGFVLALTVVVGGFFLIIKQLFLSSHLEGAMLTIEDVAEAPPRPGDTTLRIAAGGVDGCPGDELDDFVVDETEREVLVSASIRVSDGIHPGCEVREVQKSFIASLDRPLGRRLIVNNSRSSRTVIWSPEIRAGLERSSELTEADAESFVRSHVPGAHEILCGRPNFRYFMCRYRKGPKQPEVPLKVSQSGEFSIGP
jgi:hypothetical protein